MLLEEVQMFPRHFLAFYRLERRVQGVALSGCLKFQGCKGRRGRRGSDASWAFVVGFVY